MTSYLKAILPGLLGLLVLSAGRADAGVQETKEPLRPFVGPPAPKSTPWSVESKPHVRLGGTLLIHGTGQLADYLTTQRFLRHGVPEGNPVVAGVGLTTIKLAVGGALCLLDVLAQRFAPELVKPLRVLSATFYAALAGHNYFAVSPEPGR